MPFCWMTHPDAGATVAAAGALIAIRSLANPAIASTLNDDFLIETAEEGLLVPSGPRGRRQPIGDLVAP